MTRALLQALTRRLHRARALLRSRREGARIDEIGARTRNLELRAHNLLGGLAQGTWSSLFRGSGVEPHGVRPYLAGDGIRFVDWRVTARKGRLHVREFTEDRGTDVLMVLDRSPSLVHAPGPAATVAAETAAALAMAAARAGNPTGLLRVGAEGVAYLPPRPGPLQLRRILHGLVSTAGEGGGTSLHAALDTVRSVLTTGSLVVLVSDFRVGGPKRGRTTSAVAGVAAVGRVLLVRIGGPTLLDLPPVGTVAVRDPATGRLLDFDTRCPRQRAEAEAEERALASWWGELSSLVGRPMLSMDALQPLAPQIRRAMAPRGRWAA